MVRTAVILRTLQSLLRPACHPETTPAQANQSESRLRSPPRPQRQPTPPSRSLFRPFPVSGSPVPPFPNFPSILLSTTPGLSTGRSIPPASSSWATRRSPSPPCWRFLLIADPASLHQSPKAPAPASNPRRTTHRHRLDTARRDATATGHRPDAFLSQSTRPPPEWAFHRRSQILHRRFEPRLSSRTLRFPSIP